MNGKPWYEKIGIWVTIIAGICAVLGVRVFDSKSLIENNESENSSVLLKENQISMDNQLAVVIGDNNIFNYNNIANNNPETDKKESSDINEKDGIKQESDNGNINTNFPQEKIQIEQNYDLIQQMKEKYTDSDSIIIENRDVEFYIRDKAGCVYRDIMKTGKCEILAGEYIHGAKIIILDYFSDEILDVCTSINNGVQYLPESQFYCVIFHDEYEMYVTPSIQVVGGEGYNYVPIYMDKKDAQYTPLFQFNLYMRDLQSNGRFTLVSKDYIISLYCMNIYSGMGSTSYIKEISKPGKMLFWENSYFSLRTDYSIHFSLFHKSDEDIILSGQTIDVLLAEQTIDGFIIDSNIVDIFFEVDK